VDKNVVGAAQQHEIRELGLTLIARPVLDVMRIDESGVGASGELTTAITRIECSPDRAR
jgi:hypothetical protein